MCQAPPMTAGDRAWLVAIAVILVGFWILVLRVSYLAGVVAGCGVAP